MFCFPLTPLMPFDVAGEHLWAVQCRGLCSEPKVLTPTVFPIHCVAAGLRRQASRGLGCPICNTR